MTEPLDETAEPEETEEEPLPAAAEEPEVVEEEPAEEPPEE